jgi:hypothetical protein
MMTSKPIIHHWQTALARLHKLREPLADQSRKELRELVKRRGIIIYTANGGWWYESNSERSTGTFRSERAALVAALDFFGEDE